MKEIWKLAVLGWGGGEKVDPSMEGNGYRALRQSHACWALEQQRPLWLEEVRGTAWWKKRSRGHRAGSVGSIGKTLASTLK